MDFAFFSTFAHAGERVCESARFFFPKIAPLSNIKVTIKNPDPSTTDQKIQFVWNTLILRVRPSYNPSNCSVLRTVFNLNTFRPFWGLFCAHARARPRRVPIFEKLHYLYNSHAQGLLNRNPAPAARVDKITELIISSLQQITCNNQPRIDQKPPQHNIQRNLGYFNWVS